MANDPIVNQNTNPVEPPLNPLEWAKQYEQGTLKSQQFLSSIPSMTTTGSEKTFAEITAEQQYDEYLKKVEINDKKEEQDEWYHIVGKASANVLFNTAAVVYDTLGVFDPADWRLPTIGGSIDATAKFFGYDSNVAQTTDWFDPLNYINKPFEFLDDYTFLGDGDEVGNIWTQAAKRLRDYSQHYYSINSGNSYIDFANNTLLPVVGSILGAVKTGNITAGLGQAAGLGKIANTLVNSFIMTEGTGLNIAQDVHNKVYAETLYSFDPNLKKLENQAYDTTLNSLIDKGYSKKDAEWQAMQAVEQTRQDYAKTNPDFHNQALVNAGKGADVTLKAMAPIYALNMITSNAFTRSLYNPRNILNKPSLVQGKEMFREGLPEALEEGILEPFAEQMGINYGIKGSYDYKDASELIWDSKKNDWNWDTIQSAALGFLGGAVMAGGMGIMDFKERKAQYETQQEQIRKENKIGEAAGIPELLDKATTIQKSLNEVNVIMKQAAVLETEGKIEEANALKSKMLQVQAYEAFSSGTTENLINNYKKIADSPTSSDEIKLRANEAIVEIQQMEDVYKKTKGKYYNDEGIFSSKINSLLLNKQKSQLEAQLLEKKLEANKSVQMALEMGEASLSVESEKKVVKDVDGKTEEETIVSKRDLPYDVTKLRENNFTDEKEREVFDSFRKHATENIQSVRELNDLQDRLDETNKHIYNNEKAYNEMTSKSYQSSLKFESKLQRDLSEKSKEIESLKGTDKFMPYVELLMDKYKNKINKERFNRIKNNFLLDNELKRASEEIAKKEAIDKQFGNKEKTDTQVKGSDIKESESKNPDSQPKANENLIDNIATKLASGVGLKSLSKEEQQFYINHSNEVDKKIRELANNSETEESANESEEVNPDLNEVGNELVKVMNSGTSSTPNPVKPLSEKKVDDILGETKPISDIEKQIQKLEEERKQSKEEVKRIGIKGSGHKTEKDALDYIDKIINEKIAALKSKQKTKPEVKETQQLSDEEKNALSKFKDGKIQKPLLNRQLGANFQTIINSLKQKGLIKEEGNNYVKVEAVQETKPEIIQTDNPTIKTIDNVTFGTGNKQESSDKNEDALYVDVENGIFILADGMGGESSPISTPAETSAMVINMMLGNKFSNEYERVAKLAQKYKLNEYNEFLKEYSNGTNLPAWKESFVLDTFNRIKLGEDLLNTRGFRTGATALIAKRTALNTYEIEKVGDTVFFVVDKNGNVIQSHGLSDVTTTSGYIFSIKNGKAIIEKPNTDKFTITLNEGETLVFSTDFIETEKAMNEFIATNFGKNIDFKKFQKSNKLDDSTFISIEYKSNKIKPEVTPTKSNAEIAADKIVNSEFKFAGDSGYQLQIQETGDAQKDKELKEAIDVIRDRIKNNVYSGWTVVNRKLFGGKSGYLINRPDNNGIGEGYQPNEVNNDIPSEKLQQLKELVTDYVEIMDIEDGKRPTFEEFIKSFIRNVGRKQAEANLKALGLGWELSGYGKIENYDAILNRLFRNKKDIAEQLSLLSSEITSGVEPIESSQENTTNLDRQTVVEDRESTKVAVDVTPEKQVIYQSSSFLSDSTEHKLAFSNFVIFREDKVEYDENGKQIVSTEYEQRQDELTEGKYIKSKKLLDYDAYQPGEELQVVVPEDSILMDLLLTVRNEDKSSPLYGTPEKTEDGKIKTITFRNWLKEKVSKDPNFKNTQEYWDNVPMLVKDKDGDYVSMVHDVNWFTDRGSFVGDVQEAQLMNREMRKAVKSAMENGKSLVVEISKNEGGLYSPLKRSNPIPLKNANPDAKVALLVTDKNGNKQLYYDGKPVTEKIENFEQTLKEIEGAGRSSSVVAFDLRRWGTDENGKPTYKMFYSIRPKLNENQKNTIKNLLTSFFISNNKNVADNDKQIYTRLNSELSTKLKSTNTLNNLENLIKNFIYISNPIRGTFQDDIKKLINEKRFDEVETKVTQFFKSGAYKPGSSQFITISGSVLCGKVGEKFSLLHNSMFNVAKERLDVNPELQERLDNLQSVLDGFELNINKEALGSVIYINNNFGIDTASSKYSEFLKNNLQTNITSVNIGTGDSPKYVTKIQPSIYFKTKGMVSRKQNEVSVSNDKVTQKDKQVISNTLESVSDERLEDVVDELTQDGFELFGSTIEEKVEDLKEVIKQENNESKEIVDNYVKTDPNVDNISEFTEFLNQAENQVKWVNAYLREDTTEDSSYQPKEVDDETVKEMNINLMRIDGISSTHQNQVANHISIEMGKSIVDGKIEQDKLKAKVNTELNNLLGANKEILQENLDKLKAIPNASEIAQVAKLINKYEIALGKIDLVLNNSEVIYQQVLSIVLKDLNGKLVEDEKGNKEVEIKDTVENDNDNDEEGDENGDEYSEEDGAYLGTENYSKTSLEVNPKTSITYTLRRFMKGFKDINPKTNLPKSGAMGATVYVDFDTVYDNVQSILADCPVDFKKMIDTLKLHQDKKPWLPELIEKLENSSNEIKNQFTTTMGKHALNMEFMMFSFSDGKVRLKVTNTNSSSIVNKIKNEWNSNLRNSGILVNEYGEIQMDVVNQLLNEYNSWMNVPRDLTTIDKRKVQNALAIDKFELTDEKLVQTLKDSNRKIVYNGKTYTVSTDGEKVYIRETEKNIVSSAILNYQNLTVEEQKIALEKIGDWLNAFGIELNDKAIESILKNGIYHKGVLVTAVDFFKASSQSGGAVGLLANWLKTTSSVPLEEGEFLNIENQNPLDQSAIQNTLANLQSKYSDNTVTTAFRDGKKSIYGFTAKKFITDRAKDLNNNLTLREQLRKLSFNKHSLWLDFYEDYDDLGGWSFKETFNVSHIGLTALKEIGKKVYKDNSITSLSDIDHEFTKIGLFQDTEQGTFKKEYKFGNFSSIVRTARFLFPTMSDKSTMTVTKTMSLKLNDIKYYDKTPDGKLVTNKDVNELLFNQLVLPELERILNFTVKGTGTNIKNYDKGAQMFLFMPSLNTLEIEEIDGKKITLRDILINKTANGNTVDLEKVMVYKDIILKEIQSYVSALAKQKMGVWQQNGYFSMKESINQQGETVKEATNNYLDSKYLETIEGGNSMVEKIGLAVLDFEINQLLANANSFMTIIGDPALYYKVDESQRTKNFNEKSEETFINVGKRLAAMIAPGSSIADSENEQYTQVMLNDRVALSENIEFLTKVLDNKVFDRKKYNEIKNRVNPYTDPLEMKKFELQRKSDLEDFYADYPNSNGYFDIEGTDAQEYTTWQEHLHILEKLGRLNDATVSITPEEIRVAKEMFANGTPIDQLTEVQKSVLKKVLQPIKPVYTGQIFDEAQDVMRMVYIKSSSFPLIPQVTNGTELDKLREALEDLQKEGDGPNPSPYKYVRASYQTANKVGAVSKALTIYNGDGTISIKKEDLKQASITLNRKDFRIQLDVPYKSFKKKEDTVSLGTQLNKVLFGNGMMEESGFPYEGALVSGRKLEKEYTDTFMELIDLKRQELFEELGIDFITGKSTDIKKTAIKLQKILKDEAVNRGYSKQDIEALELEITGEEDQKDINFKLPIWLSSNADRFESLLNAIVSNRIVKIKFPGASYVAGSEEGFRFQTDLKGIDKNKIVWTNKWNNQSLQAAKYDKNGKLQYAQVLAPSKFKKADGTLIDLLEFKNGQYTYVTETDTGFRLKEDMIDPELRSITTFRTPTSGHKSAAHVEIVGFLPNEVGDLMIVPRNLTKQKGLDFDVDKENSYQFWHTVGEDGKITVLKGGSREKELQNKLIRIYKSVLSNPSESVQKKINGILSMEYAKDQAELIDGWINGKEDKSYFTPLSSEYQKKKMFLGASGKIGTGAYSLDVTSHSLFEQAKSKGNQLVANAITYDHKGKPIPVPYMVKFGEEKGSTGKLGEATTLDGDRTIAEVLEELQNIALDNEKEQVMGRVNLNSYTLDVSKAMAMLGFDKSTTGNSLQFVFLSQPILVEYVKEMNNANSNLSEFNPQKEQLVISKLLNKYGDPEYDLGYNKDSDNNSILSMDALEDQLKTSNIDNNLQLAVLNRFLQLKEIGLQIRSIQTAINVDSKGLGKSIPENIEKINTILNLPLNKRITNAGKLLGDIVNEPSNETREALLKEGYVPFGSGLFKPTTVVGAFSANALSATNTLWSKHFPYSSQVIARLNNEIMPLILRGEASESKLAEKKKLILKEVKKYLNARVASETLFDNVDTQAERERLFFDRSDDKQSLATYIKDLVKSNSSLKYNALLQRLDFDINVDGSPSIIKFNNTASGSYDENAINDALLELMELNLNLKSFNGEQYTSRKLAQDLITYSYLEGGVQEAIQFVKFVPVKYLEKMGFTLGMSSIDFNSVNTLGVFGIVDEDSSQPSAFTIQFAQHNPGILPKLDNIFNRLDDEFLKQSSFTMDDLINILVKYQFIETKEDSPKIVNSFQVPLFSVRRNGQYYIYKMDGNTFTRLPIAGEFGMSEYNNVLGPINSIINKLETKTKPETIKPLPKKSDESTTTNSQRFGLNGEDSLTDIITKISNSSGVEESLVNLAKQLLPHIDQSTTIKVASIEGGRGTYTRSANVITIDTNQANNASTNELARTILKELVHSITDNEIAKHVDANNNLRTSNAPAHISALVQLFNQVSRSPEFQNALISIKEKRSRKQGLTPEENRVYYGGYDVFEFVEMMMTQPEFQKKMAETKVNDKKSVLDLFRNFVKKLYDYLGVKFESDSVAAQAIENIFILIDEKGKVKKEIELVVEKETTKFSKKNLFTVNPQQGVTDNKAKAKASIATQYIGFGEGIVGKDGKRSSTQLYREQAGQYANTGNYSSNDVIFVSIPGLRGDAQIAKREQDKTIKEALKAIESGATLITDNKSYIDSSNYNTGEKRLYQNLEAKGYTYSETVVNGQTLGVWSNKQQVQTQPVSNKPTETQTAKPFTTKVDQFTYTYNPSTGEVIHNAKSGDKVETNETQINKVLAAYAKANNFETKTFNKQDYVKIDNKVLNVNTGSRVTQKEILDLFTTQPIVQGTLPGPETKINIYAGTGENAELSNFATRPFIYNGIIFPTVEHAFQYAKGEYYNIYAIDPSDTKTTPNVLQAKVDVHLKNILNAKTATEAKALGRKNIGVDFENEQWDNESSEIMKNLIKESFEQNPNALQKLLTTGNATLTHTQDKGKWGTEFPKLLMQVREELRGQQLISQPTVSNSIKSDLLRTLEEIQSDIDNDRDVEFADVNFNDFRGYPSIQEYFNNPYGVEAREYEYIKNNKDVVEDLLKSLNVKDSLSLMEKLKYDTNIKDLNLSSNVTPILTNDTSQDEELIKKAKEVLGEYELFPGVYANKEQTEALDKLDNFVKSPRDNSEKTQSTFVLVGRGGTGKTTIVKKVIESNPGKNIMGTAISHNAKNNLSRSLKGKSTVTIASLLGYKQTIEGDKIIFKPDPSFDSSQSLLNGVEILIVDECSMIDKKVMDRIYELAPADCKIIFMGDNVQAPPIEGNEDSPTFKAATRPEYNAKLVERMRQGEHSPIVPLSDIIASNVEKPVKEIERRVIKRRDSQFNPITNQGVLFATDDNLLSELKKDFTSDVENTKVISYQNKTRQYYNNVIREMIWGKEGAKFEYNVGEILVANDLKLKQNIINNEYYKVLSVKEIPDAVNITQVIIDKGVKEVKRSFSGYKLTVQVLSEGDNFGKTLTIKLPKNSFKEEIDSIQDSLANNKKWKTFRENKENITDVQYGYAITAHKSQGSTYNNTYVIEDDILESGLNNKTANQLLYVSVTRPKNKLVIYSKQNPEESLSKEQISRMEKSGESFQPSEVEEDWTSETNECGI